MPRRLVLGCGSIGHAVVVALADRPGDLAVVEVDAERVETLRNENVPATRADPTDPEDVRSAGPADTVFVAGDDPDANRRAVQAARTAIPEATVVAYTGVDPTRETRSAIADAADRTVDRGGTVLGHLVDAIDGEAGGRLHRLRRTLRAVSGRLGVFTHDNPDPDALAAAVALRDLARGMGVEADACYFGDISHQENRALVNVLDLELHRLDQDGFDEAAFDAVALVDHSRPGVNDQLPEGHPVTVVIDHHPPRGPVFGDYVDLRDDAGATSTLLTGYYRTAGIDVGETVATALLYGIRADTRDFGREITTTDFDAAAYLTEFADHEALARIESSSVTGTMLEVLARAISNRQVRGPVLATSTGWTADRDALAQAADTLLAMDDVTVTLVLGILEDTETVIASARTRGADVDIGEVLRLAYGQIGSAGGHTDMAGAQVPLGILGDVEDQEATVEELVADVLIDRFFEVLTEERALAPTGELLSAVNDEFGSGGSEVGSILDRVAGERDFSRRDPES